MTVSVDISKRVALINSISGVCTRLLRATVLIWMYHYLLRRISQDEFASYALVTALMVFAPLFSTFFTSGISRYVVEACARGDERRATQVVSSIFPLLLFWGLLFIAGGWAFAWNINSFLTVLPENLANVRLMMVMLVTDFTIQMVMTPFAVGFHVRQKYLLQNLIEIGLEVFRMALLFAFLFGLGANVIWVVVASVSSNFLSVILVTTISRRLLPSLRVNLKVFHWATASQLFSFGLWTTLNQLAGVIYINADIIVLNKLATASDVAVFKLGLEGYNQINALVVATLLPILPVLTSLHARGEGDRMGAGVLRGARYILWFSSFLILPIIIYREPLITLYAGPRYLESAQVLALLLLLFPFMAASFFLAPVSAAKADLRGLCFANFGIQLVRLAACIYVVGGLGLGAVGAAGSTFVIMSVCHLVILGPMTLRMVNVKARRYLAEVLVKGLPAALAGGVTWILLEFLLKPASWIPLFFCGMLGALAYVVALLVFSLNAQERHDLLGIFQNVKQEFRARSRRFRLRKAHVAIPAENTGIDPRR